VPQFNTSEQFFFHDGEFIFSPSLGARQVLRTTFCARRCRSKSFSLLLMLQFCERGRDLTRRKERSEILFTSLARARLPHPRSTQ
jgi:hypothetical protein